MGTSSHKEVFGRMHLALLVSTTLLAFLSGCSNKDASFASSPSKKVKVQVDRPSGADATAAGSTDDAKKSSEVSDQEAGKTFDDLAKKQDGESQDGKVDDTKPVPDPGTGTDGKDTTTNDSTSTGGAGTGGSTGGSEPGTTDSGTGGSTGTGSGGGSTGGDEGEDSSSNHGNGHGNGNGHGSGHGGDGSESGHGNGSGNGGSSSHEEADDDEVAACLKLESADHESLRVIGSKNSELVKSTDVTAVKLTGNHASLEVNFEGSEERDTIAGLCIFAAGNQAKVDVNLTGMKLGRLVYVGRGNQPSVTVHIDKSSELAKVYADLRGNNSTLSVQVDKGGKFDCAAAYVHSKKGTFSCNNK
jgi:hypothetical protein